VSHNLVARTAGFLQFKGPDSKIDRTMLRTDLYLQDRLWRS
jgi:hypothetical protein